MTLACHKTGVSDRTAAHITSAILQDIGIIHEENMEDVVDRSKILERKLSPQLKGRERETPQYVFSLMEKEIQH